MDQTLKTIHHDFLRELVGYNIYQAARSLYLKSCIKSIKIESATALLATVLDGKDTFLVDVDLAKDRFECNCDKYVTCEHIVSALLEVIHHSEIIEGPVLSHRDVLAQMSKSEIINNLLEHKNTSVFELLDILSSKHQQKQDLIILKNQYKQATEVFTNAPSMEHYKKLCSFDQRLEEWDRKRKKLITSQKLDGTLKFQIYLFENQVNNAFGVLVKDPIKLLQKKEYLAKILPRLQQQGDGFKTCLDQFYHSSKESQVDWEFLSLFIDSVKAHIGDSDQYYALLKSFFSKFPIDHEVFKKVSTLS